MSQTHLELSHLDKFYDAHIHAVKDLSLTVAKGEIIALLGSSGCGKTSTLRMIAGFEDVTHGTITLAGKPVHQLPPAKRGVAMAFEGYSLYPPLTVRDNIAFALKGSNLSAGEAENRVNELARLLVIEDILDAYPASLSGGQQQRVSLARALARDAELFLLDEPMGQLEPRLRTLLRGHIKHYLKSRGMTAILVTHDQTEANALADRIAVMEGGILMQYATPQALKAEPANLFVGTFIGEPPMNVLPVKITRQGSNVEIVLRENRSDGEESRLADDAFPTLHYPGSAFSPAVLQRILTHRHLMMGIRPYAVHLQNTGLAGKVVANQWLGDQSHLAIRLGNHTLIAISHQRESLKAGDTARIHIDTGQLHFFDRDSGEALIQGGGGT